MATDTSTWLKQCCTGLLLVLLAGPLCANGLKPFNADYQLLRNELTIGKGNISLEPLPDGQYRYHSASKSTGLLGWLRNDRTRESSTWSYYKGTIRPTSYHFEHTSRSKNRKVDLEFDWQNHEVTNTVAGHSWTMAVPDGTLDKWSVQLALMLDLQTGKQEFSYPIADGGHLKEFRFRILGEEIIETPAGRFQTLKLERVREDSKRITQVWCAPALGYLPVQIEQQEKDGARYLSVLKTINSGLLFDTR